MHAFLACRKVKKSPKLQGKSGSTGRVSSQWQDSCMLQQSEVFVLWCCPQAVTTTKEKMLWLLRHGEEGAGEDFCRVREEKGQQWRWGGKRAEEKEEAEHGAEATGQLWEEGGVWKIETGTEISEVAFQIKKGVYFKLVPSRKWLWCDGCDGWTERVKSLQTDNRHKRPYTVFRSKSALPEQFIPPVACSQETFSCITLTDELGLYHKAIEQKGTIHRTVAEGLFP